MKHSMWSMTQVFGTNPWEPGEYRRFLRDMSVLLACAIAAGLTINLGSYNSSDRAVANLVIGFMIAIPLLLLFISRQSRSRQKRQLADGAKEPTSKSWLDGPSSRPGMIQIGQNRFIKKRSMTLFFLAWTFAPLALAIMWAYLMDYSIIGYAASFMIALILVWVSLFVAVLVMLRVKRSHETRGVSGAE